MLWSLKISKYLFMLCRTNFLRILFFIYIFIFLVNSKMLVSTYFKTRFIKVHINSCELDDSFTTYFAIYFIMHLDLAKSKFYQFLKIVQSEYLLENLTFGILEMFESQKFIIEIFSGAPFFTISTLYFLNSFQISFVIWMQLLKITTCN